MAPEIMRPDGGDATPDPSREVEFALMLSRVIDSVENNPEFLRATVYELARHKLKEEFTSESFGDVRSLSKSLETAIAGVEAFSKKKGWGLPIGSEPRSGEGADIGPPIEPTCRVRAGIGFSCVRSPCLRIWRGTSLEKTVPD